jgi:hypothetical protein
VSNYGAFSDELIEKALDGDLYTKMKDIPYSTTPQEVVTVGDMQQHYTLEVAKNGKQIKAVIS